jgi:hypothetical protein
LFHFEKVAGTLLSNRARTRLPGFAIQPWIAAVCGATTWAGAPAGVTGPAPARPAKSGLARDL